MRCARSDGFQEEIMKRSLPLFALILSAALFASPALAGPYTDDLSKCLVRSTTPEEKSLLVQWMFATMALHPDVKYLAKVTPAERAKLNQRVAALFESLLTRSCLSEARDALKNEGTSTFEASFNILGQVAGRDLASHPEVASGFAAFGKAVDSQKIERALVANK